MTSSIVHRAKIGLAMLVLGAAATQSQAQIMTTGPQAPPPPTSLSSMTSSSSGMRQIGGGPEEQPYPDPRNFGGMWQPVSAKSRHPYSFDDPPARQPILDRLARDRGIRSTGKVVGTAWTTCRPGGIIVSLFPFFTVAAMQTEDQLTLFFEDPRVVRRIWLDREHSPNIKPSYTGESVGHWEGNSLIVDTIGFNGIPELDTLGLPSSPDTHVVERFTKSADGKQITVETTIFDPANYTRALTASRTWNAVSGARQTEYDCTENVPAEDLNLTVYLKPLYRPICVRYEGKGDELGKMICKQPKD